MTKTEMLAVFKEAIDPIKERLGELVKQKEASEAARAAAKSYLLKEILEPKKAQLASKEIMLKSDEQGHNPHFISASDADDLKRRRTQLNLEKSALQRLEKNQNLVVDILRADLLLLAGQSENSLEKSELLIKNGGKLMGNRRNIGLYPKIERLLDKKSEEFAVKDEAAKVVKLEKRAKLRAKLDRDTSISINKG
jgi:hypothetical protein